MGRLGLDGASSLLVDDAGRLPGVAAAMAPQTQVAWMLARLGLLQWWLWGVDGGAISGSGGSGVCVGLALLCVGGTGIGEAGCVCSWVCSTRVCADGRLWGSRAVPGCGWVERMVPWPAWVLGQDGGTALCQCVLTSSAGLRDGAGLRLCCGAPRRVRGLMRWCARGGRVNENVFCCGCRGRSRPVWILL
jgi:hypothetical protein